MRADEVYVLLKGKIAKLTEEIKKTQDWKPIHFVASVKSADDLPESPEEGDMYNIETDSVYGAAGMNVVWTANGWDNMGPIIDLTPYLTKEEAEKLYQPKGDYLVKVPQATVDTLGGIKADQKTDKETVPVKIDPATGKAYVPELPGSEDLSKEATAEQILAKLQEVIPLVEQIASNGIASSVNGFSFILGEDGSVTMTYTPTGSTESEMAVLPTETTQAKIAQTTEAIAKSLKIIAEKGDA